MNNRLFPLLAFLLLLWSCDKDPVTPIVNVYVESVTINDRSVSNGGTVFGMPVDHVQFDIRFSQIINPIHIDPVKLFVGGGVDTSFTVSSSYDGKTLSLLINKPLEHYKNYTLYIDAGEHLGVRITDAYNFSFVTELDSTPKFPVISDDSLLTLVQQQTFKYFWDHAHPVSGLTRERLGSGETVTSGGSGFGLMTIPVAIERGFITRTAGVERIRTVVDFLQHKADRFHGVYSHWLNGTTGKVQPFSSKDNGADLVETALLMQGLLTVQQYLRTDVPAEKAVADSIQQIWEEVEWNWFQRDGQNRLFWHWSPNYGWDMNMSVTGWNEALIVYLLAASSPTYPITKAVYDQGWARNGDMQNGRTFYNITLPLGEDKGGPMFFAHYSFVGLDPRGLSDAYANYWEQNRAHALINHAYCDLNPKGYFGYSADCWGLTASDIPDGYTASSPNNDRGTIAPTAALASMPYTPDESMAALRFFYYVLGDQLWGDYGFRDAFNLNKRWFASSYLAIDQGPIVLMIENHRTALLWNLFMQHPDVVSGLNKLEFSR